MKRQPRKKSESFGDLWDANGRAKPEYQVEPAYVPRFVTKAQLGELINLYHLAKVALAGTCPGRYQKLHWACDAFCKEHPEIDNHRAYKDLDAQLSQ